MVLVAVVALLITAALPAVVVTQWARPRRVSTKTRTIRTAAAVPVVALPMLWACACFVSLLSPECFVVPAFGDDVVWESDGGASPLRPGSAGATWTTCASLAAHDADRSSLIPGVLLSQRCGPLTFDRIDRHDGDFIERHWSLSHRPWSTGAWSCLSSNARGSYGPRELVLWTSADRSLVTYECRALEPALDAGDSSFITQPPLSLRAVHEPRGPGVNMLRAIALFIASLALSAGAFAWLQRADRRSRSRLFRSDAPPGDDAAREDDDLEVGATPFRSSRLARPVPLPQRSPRRAAFERGLRLRWCMAAAAFAAGLVASLAAVTHHGHVPGRPLVTTRSSFGPSW